MGVDAATRNPWKVSADRLARALEGLPVGRKLTAAALEGFEALQGVQFVTERPAVADMDLRTLYIWSPEQNELPRPARALLRSDHTVTTPASAVSIDFAWSEYLGAVGNTAATYAAVAANYVVTVGGVNYTFAEVIGVGAPLPATSTIPGAAASGTRWLYQLNEAGGGSWWTNSLAGGVQSWVPSATPMTGLQWLDSQPNEEGGRRAVGQLTTIANFDATNEYWFYDETDERMERVLTLTNPIPLPNSGAQPAAAAGSFADAVLATTYDFGDGNTFAFGNHSSALPTVGVNRVIQPNQVLYLYNTAVSRPDGFYVLSATLDGYNDYALPAGHVFIGEHADAAAAQEFMDGLQYDSSNTYLWFDGTNNMVRRVTAFVTTVDPTRVWYYNKDEGGWRTALNNAAANWVQPTPDVYDNRVGGIYYFLNPVNPQGSALRDGHGGEYATAGEAYESAVAQIALLRGVTPDPAIYFDTTLQDVREIGIGTLNPTVTRTSMHLLTVGEGVPEPSRVLTRGGTKATSNFIGPDFTIATTADGGSTIIEVPAGAAGNGHIALLIQAGGSLPLQIYEDTNPASQLHAWTEGDVNINIGNVDFAHIVFSPLMDLATLAGKMVRFGF